MVKVAKRRVGRPRKDMPSTYRVPVSYDKESYIEQIIEDLRIIETEKVDQEPTWSQEQMQEAIRELDSESPVERARRLERERQRMYFNRFYNFWVAGTIIGMFLMYQLGKMK